jgi:thiol-disulfide isomerase/thioredoxin
MWFGDETRLLCEMQIDMAPVYNAMRTRVLEMQKRMQRDAAVPSMPEYRSYLVTTSPANTITNKEHPRDRYVFTPAPGLRKVDEFEFSRGGAGGPDTTSLIGQAAPAFASTDLDGKPISLDELRGRVVLLDFWATWCGPCVKAIPHIQKVAEQFSDRPVTILGINRDQPGSIEKVRSFLAKKNITFRQAMSGTEQIGREYKVSGIPTTVLIDPRGVIQSVHIGFGEGAEQRLASEIESVLEGKPIARASEPVGQDAAKAQAGDDNAAEAPPTRELMPQRLTELDRLKGTAPGGPFVRHVDIDGDGQEEITCPGWNGELNIVSSGGESIRKMRFDGMERLDWVSRAEPMLIDGNRCWFLIVTRYGGSPNQALWSQACLFDDEGKAMWRFKPDAADEVRTRMVATWSELEGDSKPRFIIGTTLSKSAATLGKPKSMEVAYVAVLDASGTLLGQRRVGNTIDHIAVVGAEIDGRKPTILCFADKQVRRLRWDPAADGPVEPAIAETATSPESDSAEASQASP